MFILTKPLNGGVQMLYRFSNGYGASVVRHSFSYGSAQGFWEIAVIKWSGEDFEIVYDTPITNDVIGYVPESEIKGYLSQIEAL